MSSLTPEYLAALKVMPLRGFSILRDAGPPRHLWVYGAGTRYPQGDYYRYLGKTWYCAAAVTYDLDTMEHRRAFSSSYELSHVDLMALLPPDPFPPGVDDGL